MAHNKTKKRVLLSRQKKFLRAYSESPAFNISECCKTAGIGRRTFYNWLADDPQFKVEFEELNESRLDAIESALHSRAVSDKDTTALIFLAKTLLKNRGYVEGNKISVDGTNSVVRDSINELIAGSITIDMAALKIAREGISLPKTLEIMLAKQEGNERETDLPCITTDELEQRYKEAMAHIEDQRTHFLTERRKDVERIKKSLEFFDSFASEN